ncbi:hypothetical protein TSUD_200180 [Trifolium subterraneum]|nr:hypothetical protein TSUD_200180 [Trifolium subterraneum]
MSNRLKRGWEKLDSRPSRTGEEESLVVEEVPVALIFLVDCLHIHPVELLWVGLKSLSGSKSVKFEFAWVNMVGGRVRISRTKPWVPEPDR